MAHHAAAQVHIAHLHAHIHPVVPDYFKKASKFCGPNVRFKVLIVCTIISFVILCLNYYFKGPVIPFKDIKGSGLVVPSTSLTLPISGL